MDLQHAVDRLYGGAPDGFIALRATLAKEARESGDRRLATQITALRRPTVSAWLINMESRANPSLISQLGNLGDKLRGAQERLDGAAIRTLDIERKALLSTAMSALATQARAHGQALSDAVRSELEGTLSAAVLDPDSARLVESGALSSALSHVGFGSPLSSGASSRVPLRAVPDLPDAPRQLPKLREEALERAEQSARALDEAREATVKAQERAEAIQARIDQLRQELADASDEVRAAKEAQRKATRGAAAAMRRLDRR